MAPPGGTRGRGASRAGRATARGRGGTSAIASAASAALPTPDEEPAPAVTSESTADPDFTPDAQTVSAARAVTVDSSQSQTQSPTPAPATRGRFKPKNIRRDASERQKLEDERNRDLAAKIKIEEKEQRDADRRSRRGRGRGRGDTTQHFTRRTVAGGGTFSGNTADGMRQGAGAWGQGSGGPGGPSSKGGLQPQYSHRYHDRRVNDVRVNIDSIRDSIMPEPGQTNGKSPNMLPVGISRIEHKAEDAKVATSAELAAEEQEDDEDDLFVDGQAKSQMDMDMIKDDEVWHAAPAESKTVEVKSEAEEDDGMDIDTIPAIVKAPPSPELQKKLPVENVETDARARAKEKRRERALQDLELQAMNMDTEALLQGLTISGPAAEGDEPEDPKEGKLFLFQFPPILPPLRPLNADGNEVVDIEDRIGADGLRIKPDPDAWAPGPTNAGLPPGGGYIGKLNVRKSGKVELDWGGQILDLGIATETDFLTSAIIVDEHESDLASGQGKATGMGVVFGKFVATPIFDDEEDWEPDLDALGLEV